MQNIKAPPERVIGFVNGKRVKTTAKKWLHIMEDPKNIVVFKEDKDIEQEVECRGYTEDEIKESTKEDNNVQEPEANKEGAEAVRQCVQDIGDHVCESPEE
jgi:hypothetical protein